MNLAEKNTVIDFLKSKKLSYPLYKEVLDHFFLDVDQKMSEGMGFQEAFIYVKLKWHDEFKMVSPDILSIGRIPRIEARIRQSYYKAIFKNSFIIAGVFLLFQLLYPPLQSYIIVGLSFIFVLFFLHSLISRNIDFLQVFRLFFNPMAARGHALVFGVFLFGEFFSKDFFEKDYTAFIRTFGITYTLIVFILLLRFQKNKKLVL